MGVMTNPARRARTPLTETEVAAIRTACVAGTRIGALAAEYGVHRCTIWRHCRGDRKS
jgi:hypothetical protein